jgi:hexosaminidase
LVVCFDLIHSPFLALPADWHVSDSQSFPLQVLSHPRLWTAAFTPGERYLQSDVADVVEYARLRGIRVIVEFDVPGHAQSWCGSFTSAL